jgi:regulatory protein
MTYCVDFHVIANRVKQSRKKQKSNAKLTMNAPQQKNITFAMAAEKIRRYCAYQERCQSDVRQKLCEWQIEEKNIERLIKDLVSEGYINDERFAKAYARGKFKIKSWGIAKISNELRRKSISENHIAQALKEIDATTYQETLNKLANQWLTKHKAETKSVQKQKLFRYLFSKGYQSGEILEFVDKYDE